MKKYFKILLFLFINILFLKAAYSQTVIDYTTWSTTQCNAFYPFPPTINGSLHTTTCGTVIYDNTNHAIQLDTKAENNVYKGTEYKLSGTFKQKFSYSIKINAWANTPVFPVPNSKMRVDFTTASNGSGSFCNGVEAFNTTSSLTNDNNKEIPSGSFSDYTFNFTSLQVAQSNLYIGSFLPYINGVATSWILIKKITITETPPAVSFSISSLPSSLTCGATTPVIFTVNNDNSTPGVITYTWNLGTIPNGWLLPNGTAAPATYSTNTTSTLALTPSCGKALSNISATATVAGILYNTTNNAAVTITQPALVISPATAICGTSGQYQVTGLPCNAAVAWTSSNTSIATVPPSGNPVTVSRVGSATGSITLTAVVSGLCGTSNKTLTQAIVVGSAALLPTFTPGYWTSVPNPPTTIYGSGCFTSTYKGMSFTYSGVSNLVAIPYNNSSYPYVVANVIAWNYPLGISPALLRVDYDVACGHVTQILSISNTCSGYSYVIAPNPAASSEITITPADETAASQRTTLANGIVAASIDEINIYDQQGNLKDHRKYNKVKTVKININYLTSGTYLIEIVSGTNKERQQLIVQR